MPGLDNAEIELTLEKYETRGEDFEDDIETRWKVDTAGLDRPCAGETPSEALRVLADSLEHADDRFADIDELIDAKPEEDPWEVIE